MSFNRESKHTARKKHLCEWCLNDITPGEIYHYNCGTFDGDFFSFKIHEECKSKLDFVLSKLDCSDEYYFNYLTSVFEDYKMDFYAQEDVVSEF